MLILFQHKIIYMPSMPPFSRREKIAEYEGQCAGVGWREVRVWAADGVELGVVVGTTGGGKEEKGEGRQVVVLYFQG